MSSEIHLLKGSDPVLLNDAVVELIDRLVGDSARDEVLAEFSGDDYDLGAVVLASQTISMFGDRVVVARNLGRFGTGARTAQGDDDDAAADDAAEPSTTSTSDVSMLIDYLGDPSPDASLVLVWSPPNSPGVRRGAVPRKLTAAVKEAGGTVSDHGMPKGKGTAMWVDDHLGAAGVRLDRAAKELVVGRLGEDLSRLDGILRVLEATYGTGAGPLGPDDVDPFLGDAGGVPPWDVTDAIDSGRVADAVTNVRRMNQGGGRHPLAVMATLNTHYGRMLRIDGAGVRDEKEAASLLGMTGSTFPAKKALTQADRLGSAKLARATQLLARADVDLRGRSGAPGEATLEVLVARLAALSGTGGRSGRGGVSRRR
ncbi:MAG TPA: DNA polymerase III subunit delta [Microthrixaceae bacterium]|nr:DNA polymerase III subunit delta [Microthrixaceae bacterium]